MFLTKETKQSIGLLFGAITALALLVSSIAPIAPVLAQEAPEQVQAVVDDGSKKVNICHKTNSPQNPWNLVSISVNAENTHEDHHDDFEYDGPVDEDDEPTVEDGDQWCADNAPDEDPKDDEESKGDNGTLLVCKVIVDAEGNIVDGSEADGQFGIAIDGPDSYSTVVEFETALSLTHDLLDDNGDDLDAECVEFTDLDAGTYTYDEESIEGLSDWGVELYHDYFNETPNEVADFYELTEDGSETDNDNADGVINLSKNGARKLVVVNTYRPEEDQPFVCEADELVMNGSFESPVVTHDKKWNIFNSGTAGLAWMVNWITTGGSEPTPASLELHRGVNGWASADGSQHAELDGDWQGPGGSNGEDASTAIYQDLLTKSGEDYHLSFAFSPRPNTGASDNTLEVWWEGVLLDTIGPEAGSGDVSWASYEYDVPATADGSRLEFRDAGTGNSSGTFIDNVSVCGLEYDEPDMCTEESDPWGYSVESFTQGDRKNGSDVVAERSDETQALGEAENDDTVNFAALGFGGEIVIGFEAPFPNGDGDDIQVFETTFGNETDESYPESADVYASKNGVDFTFLGSVGVNGGTVDLGGLDWAQYVKIVDTSDKESGEFPGTADGFDVDAVKVLHCGPTDDDDDDDDNPPVEDEGVLRICKILLDENGDIVAGNSIDATFEIGITGPDAFADTATFTTALSYTDDHLVENDDEYDAECVEFTGLAAGEYQYSEEVITSDTIFDTPKYNDQFNENVKNLLDFYSFAVDGSGDDNDNNDGIINIPENKTRELIVLNQISDENEDDNDSQEEAPTVDLYANGEDEVLVITEGTEVELNWVVTNDPDTCTASSDWSGDKSPFDDSSDLGALSVGVHVFTLECENEGGTDSDSVTVTVEQANTNGGGGSSGSSSSSSSSGSVLGASIGPEGEVLGASCGLYLNEFMHIDSPNNDSWEVMKLQMFLNSFINSNLPVNGIFGEATETAVRRFQTAYNDMSLTPWQLLQPTGYVYKTTKWTINMLMCPELGLPVPTPLAADNDITDQE